MRRAATARDACALGPWPPLGPSRATPPAPVLLAREEKQQG
jgi:hypothetical protein